MPTYNYPAQVENVWRSWVGTGTGTTTASTINYDQVWYSWTATTATGATVRFETDEDVARRRQRFDDMNHAVADEQMARRAAIDWAHANLPAEERQAYIDATRGERSVIRNRKANELRQQRWIRRALEGYFQGEDFAEARQAFIDAPYEEKTELLRLHKEELDRRRRQAEERARNAESRAEQLLKMVIPAEEYERWKHEGEIRVTGSEGGVYVIRGNTHEGNVDWYENGERVGSFCAHPRMRFSNGNRLPLPDAIAAQYLALVHDEWQFIATANVYNYALYADGAERMHRRKRTAVDAVAARSETAPPQRDPVQAAVAA